MQDFNLNEKNTFFITLSSSDYQVLNRIAHYHGLSLNSYIVREIQEDIKAFLLAEEFLSQTSPIISKILESVKNVSI